jgi:2-C-methyl-D-erythritol 4-phosphate cytidylyltransferase
MKKYAVIVAGGSGVRMGGPVPKQFLLLRGKPVLWYTLNTFLAAYADLSIVLVAPADHAETCRELIDSTVAAQRIQMVAGGDTRFHSVRNGLAVIQEEAVIFVHDGVRCLVSTPLIHRCYEAALRSGSAIPVVGSRDSVRLVTAAGSEAIDRSRVKLVQTPQTFLSKILIPAYQAEYRPEFTDEATVVEAAGHTVYLTEGEPDNIKITLPADLLIAERLLQGA